MAIRLGLVAVVAILMAHSFLSARPRAQTLSQAVAEQAEPTRVAQSGAVGGSGNAEQTVSPLLCPQTNPFCGPVFDPPVADPGSRVCGPPSSATIVATLPTIRLGESTTVQWTVTYPSDCVPRVTTVDGQTVGNSGSKVVAPMASRPYALFIGGNFITQVTVVVQLPAVVRITGNTFEWKQLLVQALRDPLPGLDGVPQDQRPGRTVLLAHNLDMDLTNRQNIYISQGVTLTSELPPPGHAPASAFAGPGGPGVVQGPVARNPFSLGPRLYTTSSPRPLFHIQCDGATIFGDRARVSGFRLQGPHFDSEEGDDKLERGIQVTSCKGVEISNMEISGWSGQAIYISDAEGRISSFDDVKVVGNFIHHNQHDGGNGYGVETTEGGMASIERNVFDFNRHAIAAGGYPGVGYRAFMNLVLKGGGYHGTIVNTWTHQFDVHGDATCGDIFPFYDANWKNCGNAGDTFQYVGNTVQFTVDKAIKIRGTPRNAAVIHNNVFAHDDLDDAVAPTDNASVQIFNNTTDSDQYGQYGVCDFDGDGRDDLFLATGVTWWYSSAGRREWTFLNARPEKLNSIGLGDFDGDGRCDVFAVHGHSWSLSKRGTSAFTSLGLFAVPFSQLAFGDFNGDRRQDIFRRAPDGQWFAISPGVYPWTPLASSNFPLSSLRFGDFDGNGMTDVIAIERGRWAVSWDARTIWLPLNPHMSSSLAEVFIANVDGIPGDDIVQLVYEDAVSVRWDVSSGGAGPWSPLTSLSYRDSHENNKHNLTGHLRTFVGRFDVWNGADMLVLEYTRGSVIFSAGHANLTAYGLYAY
jgi:hypothetical protein